MCCDMPEKCGTTRTTHCTPNSRGFAKGCFLRPCSSPSVPCLHRPRCASQHTASTLQSCQKANCSLARLGHKLDPYQECVVGKPGVCVCVCVQRDGSLPGRVYLKACRRCPHLSAHPLSRGLTCASGTWTSPASTLRIWYDTCTIQGLHSLHWPSDLLCWRLLCQSLFVSIKPTRRSMRICAEFSLCMSGTFLAPFMPKLQMPVCA